MSSLTNPFWLTRFVILPVCPLGPQSVILRAPWNKSINKTPFWKTIQTMLVERNFEWRSCNHCCNGIAISIITRRECVFIALGIQHGMRMRCTVIRDLSACTIFLPHYIINGTIFEKKKLLNVKCVVRFYLQILSEKFLIIRIEQDNDPKFILVFM